MCCCLLLCTPITTETDFVWRGLWMFIKKIFTLSKWVPYLQADKAHKFIPYFQTFLLLWQFEIQNSHLPLSGLHHTSKPQQTLHEIYFFFFLNDYPNNLCCPDIQCLYVVFTAKDNPVSGRLKVIDFMGITLVKLPPKWNGKTITWKPNKTASLKDVLSPNEIRI